MKNKVRKIIQKYMIDRDILHGFTGLAKECGMTRKTLNERLNNPKTFRLYEILAIDEVLHFSDEDLLILIRGE